jgi:2-amino-4-hydroxy-6-hydroxymethyldihydropteridine diphosphokinase
VTECCIGLGANLGAALDNLRGAAAALAALPGTRLLAVSRVYRSAPVGPTGQDDYLNAAVRLATELEPEALLDAAQAIEAGAGRVRTQHWGPRTLDLDLLLCGDTVIDTERLTVPHPRLAERNFVLLPLIDLLGERYRLQGRSLADWVENAPRNRIEVTELSLGAVPAEPA